MTKVVEQEIREVIEANRDKLPAVLHGYWHRSVRDFVGGGIDRNTVAESIYTAAVVHMLAAIGSERLIKLLRETADLHAMYQKPEDMPPVTVPPTSH